MLAKTNERTMRLARLIITTGWLSLICSLFLDSALASSIFWSRFIPFVVFTLLVFGHEFWRRICPLSFLSQIPRALGWQRQRKHVNAKTGKVRYELVKVPKNSWLSRNAIYVQMGLFFLGLCSRILLINSNPIALGATVIATILAAITVGYLYGGKSWCNYFCPMYPVEMIYGQPRGLLNSTAHEGERQKITQSMCRTIDKNGKEQSACMACNSPCLDIDAERSYWENITKPDQQLLYYGYFGIALGYFAYYYFRYGGNWNLYTSGEWAQEQNQLETLLQPVFYLFGEAIPLPKLVAVPLTLGIFTAGSYWVGKFLEKRYKAHQLRNKQPLNTELIRHRMFTLTTFVIFNVFFMFTGAGLIDLLPEFIQYLFPILVAVCSSLWLYRTWQRDRDLYQREGLASRLRKQLVKLNIDTSRFLEGRSLPELSADEVYVLAKVLPGFNREKKRTIYKGVLLDALEEGYVTAAESLTNFARMRLELDIPDSEHEKIIVELGQERPDLFDPSKMHSRENLLRLQRYRETLLETILESWQDNPEKTQVAQLLKVFTAKPSQSALEQLLQNLSPEDLKIVHSVRQQYGITDADERDALRQTDKEELWKAIAEEIGWLDNLDCEEKLIELFNQFDQDHSGYINFDELKLCLRDLESNFTDSQIRDMLEVADTSGDEQISYQEFCQIFAAIGCTPAMEVISRIKTKLTVPAVT